MSSEKTKTEGAYHEYRYFLSRYLLPLIGISYNNNLEAISDKSKPESISAGRFIRQEENKVVFSTYSEDVFFMAWYTELAEDSKALAQSVIHAFFDVSKYHFSKKSRYIQFNYKTDAIREENYKLAVQKGVCDWCAGRDNEPFYRLIRILEQWSVKTYEGNKVTFGFIYDPEARSALPKDGYGDWLTFLEDDYAATLTDCIHSVIRLDKDCNYVDFISVTEKNRVEAYQLTPILPYRFARILEKHVIGSCVGVFLLNNGDILISKNKSVRLIKRNLKWLNLSFETFYNMVKGGTKKAEISDDLIKEIYASTLDVSFAHTGGIIAVVSDISKLLPEEEPVLNFCDNLLDEHSLPEMNERMKGLPMDKNLSPTEREKRLLKRKIVQGLVSGRNFSDLDRKLRAELISMDGACILNFGGNVCAVGAIIRNESGSSGGGRNAAAKKLSRFGGLAVKVSTDGYIELFVDNKAIYAIK